MSNSQDGARALHPETRLVHAGTMRSQFGETSEALFLTQGHVYDSAEQCEARFLNKDPGFQYARFSNPTVAMLEQRMAAFEGAEACRATATGMAAVTAAVMGQVKAGDHVVAAQALFGSCRYVVEEHLPRYGVASTLVDGTDIAAWRAAVRPNTKVLFLESPSNPTLEVIDIAAVAAVAQEIGATLGGRQCLRHAAVPAPARTGRRLRGLFRDQAHRWAGPLPGRADPGLGSVHHHPCPDVPAPDRTGAVALQRLGDAEGAGDAAAAHRAPGRAAPAQVADWLAGTGKLTRLIFPGRADHPQAAIIAKQMSGPSTLIAFEVAGGKEAAFRLLERGQADPDLEQSRRRQEPDRASRDDDASALHARGARVAWASTDGMIRLSIGLEHADDLIADLAQALAAI